MLIKLKIRYFWQVLSKKLTTIHKIVVREPDRLIWSWIIKGGWYFSYIDLFASRSVLAKADMLRYTDVLFSFYFKLFLLCFLQTTAVWVSLFNCPKLFSLVFSTFNFFGFCEREVSTQRSVLFYFCESAKSPFPASGEGLALLISTWWCIGGKGVCLPFMLKIAFP